MPFSLIAQTAHTGPPVSRWFGFLPEFRKDALGFLLQACSYGQVVRLPLGRLAELWFLRRNLAVYLLNDPADVKHVLVTNQHNYTKAPVPPIESHIFGQGLLHAEGARHHHQRRLLLPFFQRDHVATYAQTITAKAAELAADWKPGLTLDISQEMTRLTLSVIWCVLFGREVGREAEQVVQCLPVGHRLITQQYNSLVARMTPLWVPTTIHREFARGHNRFDALVRQMIHTRRSTAARSPDVLSLLLAATDETGQRLSEEAIRDELVTLILAGHETTANALTWTWFLLSQYRTVRERLKRELREVLTDHLPTVQDLPRLVYTRMVWNEALRLYPPAWLLHMRVAGSEDTLPSGVQLEQGANVFLSPWSMHRNPRWFPDSNRFDPERFSPKAMEARPAFSYFPFGGGGHRCLGEAFAELEGILALATLASRVNLRLLEGQTILPDPLMTLRPNGPVSMTVEV